MNLRNIALNTFPSTTSMHAVADRVLQAANSEEKRREVVRRTQYLWGRLSADG